jgi:hypothetical protein
LPRIDVFSTLAVFASSNTPPPALAMTLPSPTAAPPMRLPDAPFHDAMPNVVPPTAVTPLAATPM